jgi:hypothetical protein
VALTLFSRRPAPVEPPVIEPEPWPEIGETWKPEGVNIVQRYYNQAHTVVLVYTADDGKAGTYYAVACLGCHFASAQDGRRTWRRRPAQAQGPRPVPDRGRLGGRGRQGHRPDRRQGDPAEPPRRGQRPRIR